MDNINSQPHLQDNPISTANIKQGELRSRTRSAQTYMRRSDFHEQGKSNSSSSSHSSFTLSGCETVGIVGSGMAGLVVAFLLANDSQKRYDVEVLEVQDVLSLDSASFELPRFAEGSVSAAAQAPGPNDSGFNSTSVSGAVKDEIVKDQKEGEDEVEGRRVDLPMRAFAAGYYDNLLKMYKFLGVVFASPKFVYSISFSRNNKNCPSKTERKDEKRGAYFIHSSNNHILPPIRPAGVGATKYVFELLYLLFWYLWFTFACFWIPPKTTMPLTKKGKGKGGIESSARGAKDNHLTPHAHDPTSAGSSETLRAYLSRIGIPSYYTTWFFLPLMSSITTCTHEELLNFPASDIIGYARQTYRKPHYTLTRGVKQAEMRLSSGLNVKYNHRATKVETLGSGRVRVHFVANAGTNNQRVGMNEYDRVIIATTPDVVGRIFSPLSLAMKAIPTTEVRTVVHRDYSGISKVSAHLRDCGRLQKRGIRSFEPAKPIASSNGSVSASGSSTPVLTAMHMVTETDASGTSRTESVHEHPANVLVTTYALENSISEEQVLHSVRFTRVLRTPASRDIVNSLFSRSKSPVTTQCEEKEEWKGAVSRKGWKNGDGNVYLVGGWCWDGMVLLEGCVVSAMRVARELGVEVPWDGSGSASARGYGFQL
ncbi:predicted protein [Aspergillus nidulans FGSC A4]|uniref:Amine oxidase domain-containing protein n=1 Tax=Emericella nidulans (strain FGSC A4 / ATCC 38163 / CBS 112.46 / NRRL 194 / M139) TaxID=227321 RepID=Q5B509_EMENI|nr:hypothetical protein [Aspergillus nidulans FGSC A4]EAA60288.1 predicted protein [Aspergillus nidulans FGSC A4]CBF77662.1 TPA: conserved hypothetical protein [Aspergillus nidulans FGSC A4]|eukprot:XP_661975.1 predicted protein [Aspergillus nidulans FGSC A4]